MISFTEFKKGSQNEVILFDYDGIHISSWNLRAAKKHVKMAQALEDGLKGLSFSDEPYRISRDPENNSWDLYFGVSRAKTQNRTKRGVLRQIGSEYVLELSYG
jgi:hypothetical protein